MSQDKKEDKELVDAFETASKLVDEMVKMLETMPLEQRRPLIASTMTKLYSQMSTPAVVPTLLPKSTTLPPREESCRQLIYGLVQMMKYPWSTGEMLRVSQNAIRCYPDISDITGVAPNHSKCQVCRVSLTGVSDYKSCRKCRRFSLCLACAEKTDEGCSACTYPVFDK